MVPAPAVIPSLRAFPYVAAVKTLVAAAAARPSEEMGRFMRNAQVSGVGHGDARVYGGTGPFGLTGDR